MRSLPGSAECDHSLTCRTLLQTVMKTPLRIAPPGHGYHFGFTAGIRKTLSKVRSSRAIGKTLNILLFIEGLPISKRNGSELWSILALINNFKNTKPFLAGIYHGPKKPSSSSEFLNDFVDQMLIVSAEGVSVGNVHFSVNMNGFICDASRSCIHHRNKNA